MQYGLYGGGAVSASFLAGLPRLGSQLGPVAATSYRLASRIVNGLRAGHAVKDLAAFGPCPVVLVAVPETTLTAAGSHLAAAHVRWTGKVVLLCGCGPESRVLDGVRSRGAAVGSVGPVEFTDGRYIVEGDRPAVREARRLVRELRGRAIELPRSAAPLYDAGVTLATSLFTPLIAASVDSLRKAGCSRIVAAEVAEGLFQKTLRAWAHVGRRSWTGPVARGDLTAMGKQIEALARHDPAAARYYRQASAFAFEYLHRHPELLTQL